MKLLNLLAAAAGSEMDKTVSSEGKELVKVAYGKFMNIINVLMPVLIAVVLVFGLVYSIILGIAFAKAEDTETRDKAKQRLINVIIGVLVAAIIMGVIYAILAGDTIETYFKNNKLDDSISLGSL